MGISIISKAMLNKTMQLTTFQSKLISDAQAFGYTLTMERNCFRLVKRNKKKIVSGIVFWEDGTIYRLDIPAELSINLRTQKAAREVLGLGA
jgi:hypothetical protein